MYTVRKVVDDLYWIGGNDHRLALFENIFPIPRGVSYNSYLLLDEKTVVFDSDYELFYQKYHRNTRNRPCDADGRMHRSVRSASAGRVDTGL